MAKKVVAALTGLWWCWALQAQIVNTQYGQVQGSLNGSVYQFLGIPYAQAPVDSLRWRAPRPPQPWSGTRLTTSFAPVCPQKKYEQGDTTFTLEGNEDCLYLNVWTPQINSGNKAVMVFIHGGGNQQGGASEVAGGTQLYFGKNLSERGDVVVVTIQYRLGPLGFLVHPGLEAENIQGKSGNYGVMDQLLALQWVQNNISNFGGDPSKVMIFGESAGGLNVGNLLTTPLATGLFQRACIQSAVPSLGDYNEYKNKGIAWVDRFATSGTPVQKIAFLRTLRADSLLVYETSPLAGGIVQANWRPVVDKVIFNDFPLQVFQSGNFNKVPVMIGSNADEMSLTAPPVVTPSMVNVLINTYVPVALRPQALSLYPPGNNNSEARASYVRILTDAQFTAPARRAAQCIRLNQSEPVWRYFFTYQHTVPILAPLGAYHGMELFYVFNNWENATLGKGPLFKPADDSVQKLMLRYWVNFANTGNPNGSNLPAWPPFESNTDCYLEIKATPNSTLCGLRTVESDFWDQVFGFTGCRVSVGTAHETADQWLTLYPNPTGSTLFIRSEDASMLQYQIFNSIGQLVKAGAISANTVDVSGIKAGIYFLELIDEKGKVRTARFVKE